MRRVLYAIGTEAQIDHLAERIGNRQRRRRSNDQGDACQCELFFIGQ
jgi:hypothetical protein